MFEAPIKLHYSQTISVIIRDKIRLLKLTLRSLLDDFVSLSNSLTFCFTFKLITYLLKVLLSLGVFWFIFWSAVPACIFISQNTSFLANWTQLIINVSHFFTFFVNFYYIDQWYNIYYFRKKSIKCTISAILLY